MNFNFSNITSMININSMIPSTSELKSKLPAPIQKFVPDINIGEKLNIDKKINDALGPQLSSVESEMNGQINESFSQMNNVEGMPEGVEINNPLNAISFDSL